MSLTISQLRQRAVSVYRRSSRTIWFKIARVAAILSLCAFVLYIFSRLNILYIEEIQVIPFQEESLRYVSGHDIENSLVQYIGKHLFVVRPSVIEAALEKEFPLIEKAYVSKHLPDVLRVRIVERVPFIVMRAGTDSNIQQTIVSGRAILDTDLFINREGIVLGSCSAYQSICDLIPLCVIDDLSGEYIPGDTIYLPELSEIGAIQSEFAQKGFLVQSCYVADAHSIVVVFEDKSAVVFSTDDEISDQLERFQVIRENLALQGKTYKEIDMRFDYPILRFDKYGDWVTE